MLENNSDNLWLHFMPNRRHVLVVQIGEEGGGGFGSS
jgi:hypothetical protein